MTGISGIIGAQTRVPLTMLEASQGLSRKGLVPVNPKDTSPLIQDTTESGIPYGYCQCGCGQKTTVARWSNAPIGHVRGEPKRYIRGHNPQPVAQPIDPLWSEPDQCWRVPLVSRKYPGLFALVDDQDIATVREYRWHPKKHKGTFYASTGKPEIKMHRLILDASPDMDGDHIDGNGLDNRRSNIRVCDRRQNRFNTAKSDSLCAANYLGVSRKQKITVRWEASVKINGKRRHIGYFDTEVEAALARDEFLRNSPFAEYARYNFPRNGERSAVVRDALKEPDDAQ